VDLEQMQDDYEHLVTNLLEWIHTKVGELNDRNFTNSLVGIKRDMAKFTDYRLQEKPPKLVSRCDLGFFCCEFTRVIASWLRNHAVQ